MKFKFIKDNKNFFVSTVLCLGIFFSLVFVTNAIHNQSVENSKFSPTIVLDPGHGGEDGGAVGINGIVEKDINLKISLKIKSLLEISGHKVIITRDKDTAIYDENSKTLREKKRSDLKNRVKITNSNKNPGTILVSIHQNKFPDPKYFGTQIFYSVNDEKSQELANKIRECIVKLIQPENDREIKPANEKIFLLNKAVIPAVIVECGFLSNSEEAKKLTEEKYQSEIAFSIYNGILNYFLNINNEV